MVKETVPVLTRGDGYAVVLKPNGILCHHSDWATTALEPTPLLQRARNSLGKQIYFLLYFVLMLAAINMSPY